MNQIYNKIDNRFLYKLILNFLFEINLKSEVLKNFRKKIELSEIDNNILIVFFWNIQISWVFDGKKEYFILQCQKDYLIIFLCIKINNNIKFISNKSFIHNIFLLWCHPIWFS